MLFIDTDPGVDDALAILMAHARAPGVAGLGIAAGNVGLHHTTANALKLVELLGVSTPVFPGAPQPLVRRAADAAFVHGADGFGDTGYLPARRAAHNEHAALALLRLSHAHAGELVLVALGPLTNLALALSLDPQLPSRVARLVVMGGAVTGQGNASVAAEFNFRFDPEAAHIVFSRWPRFDLVDWELTLRHALDFERFEHWLAGGDARAAFFAAISRKARAVNRARRHPGIIVADALAMAVALRPELIINAEERAVAIELDGGLTRGATVVDWQRRTGAVASARIVLAVDQPGFEQLVAAALGARTG
ncbi:nucleoside hydrolase [Metallibacterium sp.]|jgi:purine nucleosidase|uniref:nucleoside hydrolase n=1 Tax=Metallibacterium sp. TaxID=2940281 RepID=UPI00262A4233|nr:nucleoside hydrolase [Metallibacterium sp.]